RRAAARHPHSGRHHRHPPRYSARPGPGRRRLPESGRGAPHGDGDVRRADAAPDAAGGDHHRAVGLDRGQDPPDGAARGAGAMSPLRGLPTEVETTANRGCRILEGARRAPAATEAIKIPRSVQDLVVVLDFGAQYSQLIARRVRELRVYSLILPFDTPLTDLLALRPKGIILSGGPASVYDPGAPRCDPGLFTAGVPTLGICYGMQLMAHDLGGLTGPAVRREYGRTRLFVDEPEGPQPLFGGLERRLICWMSHGDTVHRLPAGFATLAHSDHSPHAAIADRARRLYGLQFHPEVSHTPWGSDVLRNFLYQVCGCSASWSMESFVERAVDEIRARIAAGRAICALSGGVDSAAAAGL